MITKVCIFKGPNYNLTPALLLCPKEDGFTLALKWWNFHMGIYWVYWNTEIKS